MREALARSDNDFVLSEPRQRQSRPRAGALRILRIAYRAAAYPNRIAGALLLALVIAILVNALLLQKSRHPAPFFGRSIAIQPQQTPAQTNSQTAPPNAEKSPAAQTSPEPEAQKPARDPIAQLLKSNGVAAKPIAPPHFHHKATDQDDETKSEAKAESKVAVHDPITQLLKGNAPQAAAEPSKIVFGAQRALVRLGFVLKADGVNGAATRQAVEQFERDHGLPAKGELTAKVLRELAAQSGQAIE